MSNGNAAERELWNCWKARTMMSASPIKPAILVDAAPKAVTVATAASEDNQGRMSRSRRSSRRFRPIRA